MYNVLGDTLTFKQKITAFDHDSDNERDAFGFSLSVYDNSLAVSAFFDDDAADESGE